MNAAPPKRRCVLAPWAKTPAGGDPVRQQPKHHGNIDRRSVNFVCLTRQSQFQPGKHRGNTESKSKTSHNYRPLYSGVISLHHTLSKFAKSIDEASVRRVKRVTTPLCVRPANRYSLRLLDDYSSRCYQRASGPFRNLKASRCILEARNCATEHRVSLTRSGAKSF
jgi:hypothetical protein